MPVMPMFPLGSVLLPTVVLPLHVFEPRYRQLVQDCRAGSGEFGVVLIERGLEVGGGDVRTNVGTVARIFEVAEAPDGRYALLAIGTERVRVTTWLIDDPYPKADIEPWPDADDGALPADVEAAADALRGVLELGRQAGWDVEPAVGALDDGAVSIEPGAASHQLAALAPLGPADRYRLLASAGPRARLALLVELLGDVESMIRFGLQPDP